ncbi:exocyst complex component, putative [Entamoeba invadens IP1]|uniref:Exocyst complex component, putative n=1 Tax=Entamoeba invadens IP1 TaxID=370355 RepID=A0A0A1U9S6_ENTIV|nr:exocyst complex component, putative [Entamoeba invadens IP1]ELP91679.1 exocyst complex component, putative [Entamoeba invadens IP1]|eukprot:XP_004258450.1 exocyst complex component, putative [Entamoeba invadens IP1]
MSNPKDPVNLKEVERRLMDTNIFLQSTFDPEIFVDSLLSDQSDYSIAKGIETFDIDPFLSLLNLSKSRIDNQFLAYKKSVEEFQEQCLLEEQNHVASVTACRKKFDKALTQFKETENGVSELSTEVMQAGERLQDLATEASRGKQASLILEMFRTLNGDKNFDPVMYKKRREELDEDDDDAEVNFVIRVKKLKSLSKELKSPESVLGRKNVETLFEFLERDYLKNFKTAMAEKNLITMKDNAEMLYYLNGGDTCVDEYIESNEFLNDEVAIHKEEALAESDIEINKTVVAINSQVLAAFLKTLLAQIQKEKQRIEKIFVQKDVVLARYVQKIVEVRVTGFLSGYLYKGLDTDPDFNWKYLFLLYDSYTQMSNFFNKTLTSSGMNAVFLSDLVENVFNEDKTSNYNPTETEYIASVFKAHKDKYTAKKKTVKADSSTKVVMSGFGELIDPKEVKLICDQLSFGMVRAQTLSVPEDFDGLTTQLFTYLIQWMDEVLKDVVDKMEYQTSKQSVNPKNVENFLKGYLQLLTNVTTSVRSVQVMFEKSITPCFKYSIQKLQGYTDTFKGRIENLESGISESLSELGKWLVGNCEKILNYKNEFKLKDENDDTWVTAGCSQICKETCRFIQMIVVAFEKGLTGSNKRNFLVTFANGLHGQFIKIIKKLKITPISGGFLFMYDVSAIVDTVRRLSFPVTVRPMFENLSSLFKIFCIPKSQVLDITTAIMKDGGFMGIDPNEVLKCRTDYSKEMHVAF